MSKFIEMDLLMTSELWGVTPCIRLDGKKIASPAVNVGSNTLVSPESLANGCETLIEFLSKK